MKLYWSPKILWKERPGYFQFPGLFFLLVFSSPAQHHATRDDGRKVILHNNFTWSFADSGQAIPRPSPQLKNLEIPALLPDEILVKHTAYTLVYSEKHELARWVAYKLTAAKTEKTHERTNRFLPDPKIATGSATDADYKGSGFDRGHLAPASDMGWSETAMAESFYYSNMSPQKPSFNRGIWKRGEDLIRQWARTYGSLYIVVGPVLTNNLPTIGPNKVAIPERFYKVILDYASPEKKAIGFLMENEGASLPLPSFAVSIDSVEKATGIDFFPALPDEEENALEKEVCLPCWTWPNSGAGKGSGPSGAGRLSPCQGKNKDGSACKNYVVSSKTLCSQHSK